MTINPMVVKAYATLLQIVFDNGTGTMIPKYITNETERVHDLQKLITIKEEYVEPVNIYIIEHFS